MTTMAPITAETYMATLGLDESLEKLAILLAEIEAADKDENEAKVAIATLQNTLAIRESELLLGGVEGKNEAERKAALHLKQESDTQYKLLVEKIGCHESDLSTAQVDGAALRREWQYYRIKLEVGIAKLGFLAGQPQAKHQDGA